MRSGILACALSILPAVLAGPFLSGQSPPLVSLDLGIVAAMASAGDSVEMPLSLTAAGPGGVVRISVELAYAAAELEAIEFRRNLSLPDRVEVKTEIRDSESGEKVLQLDIASPDPIPEGEVGKIAFRIAEGVPLGSTLIVKNLRQAAENIDRQRLEAVGTDGSILVLGHISACFFYMH